MIAPRFTPGAIILLLLRNVGFVLNRYGFVGCSVYLFRAYLRTSVSGCSKDEFFGFGYGQSLNVSVKELCIVGYFDYVKATANKVGRKLPFLFKEPVGIHND